MVRKVLAKDEKRYPLWSSRLSLAIISCIAFATLFALRTNLSMAMVCMVNSNASSGFINCTHKGDGTTTSGKLNWTNEQQGQVLASFGYGYFITQLPGGMLAERYGGKHVFGISLLISGIATLLSPLAAEHGGYVWLMVLRIILGLAQGVVFPAMSVIWSHWAPPKEQSTLQGFSFAGIQFGCIVAYIFSGIMCDKSDWENIFYVPGVCAIVVSLIWFVLVAGTPEEHPRASEYEKKYIAYALRARRVSSVVAGIPWCKIATSMPVIAMIVALTCDNVSAYLFMTVLPDFLGNILKFDITMNGVFSALPYVAFYVGIEMATLTADYLMRNKILNTTTIRKSCSSIAFFAQAIFLVGLAYCTCELKYVGVTLLALSQLVAGWQAAGCLTNNIDLAPHYAGTILGISNTFGAIGGIIAPLMAKEMTPNKKESEWQCVFFATAGILAFGGIFYNIFASGEVQSWAQPTVTRRGVVPRDSLEGIVKLKYKRSQFPSLKLMSTVNSFDIIEEEEETEEPAMSIKL